jgi:hypothetical protein
MRNGVSHDDYHVNYVVPMAWRHPSAWRNGSIRSATKELPSSGLADEPPSALSLGAALGFDHRRGRLSCSPFLVRQAVSIAR